MSDVPVYGSPFTALDFPGPGTQMLPDGGISFLKNFVLGAATLFCSSVCPYCPKLIFLAGPDS